MDIRKFIFQVELILFLVSSPVAGAVFANEIEERQPLPPPATFCSSGLSGICADQQYFYVLAGGRIMQYEITSLKLQKKVDIPVPLPPWGKAPKGQSPAGIQQHNSTAPDCKDLRMNVRADSDLPYPPPPPPHSHHPMIGPHGFWAGNGFLYVLAGPVIYMYKIPDLTLHATVEIPKPEPPRAGN